MQETDKRNRPEEYEVTPTENQKKAFIQYLKKLKKGETAISFGEIMREAGYSDWTSKHPEKLVESKGWKKLANETGWEELLDRKVKDEEIIDRFNEILKEGQDRESIKAGKELKDWKYPEKKQEENGQELEITINHKE